MENDIVILLVIVITMISLGMIGYTVYNDAKVSMFLMFA